MIVFYDDMTWNAGGSFLAAMTNIYVMFSKRTVKYSGNEVSFCQVNAKDPNFT
jgi:hypothetical protein